jgi:hypothetical protein
MSGGRLPDKFSFHYPDEHTVEFATDAELADDSRRWQFWQFRPNRSIWWRSALSGSALNLPG